MKIRFNKQSFYFGILLTGISLGLLFFSACKDDTISPDIPIVVVGEVTDITIDGATFHGQIINEGPGFSEMGFVWDESGSPGYASSRKVVPVEKSIRHFSARISADHQSGKGYTVKAYLKTGEKFTFSNAVKFTSKGSQLPMITDFEPKTGLRNTEVTIYGKNFSNVLSHNVVKFGDYTGSVITSTDSTLRVKLPNDLYYSAKVKVTVTVGGKTTSSIDDFEFGGVFIDRFDPKTAPCYGKITIYGKNFKIGSYTYVYFRRVDDSNTSWAEIIRISDTEIEVKVPVLIQSLDYYVEVLTGPYSARATDLFRMEVPVITSIEPLSGMEGDTLVLKGRGMGIHYSYVYLGDNNLSPIIQSDTLLKVIVPLIQSGQYDVWIQNNCGYTAGYPNKVEVTSPWKKISNIPLTPRIDAICLAIGQNLYVGLGNDMCTTPTDYLNDWWEFNTTSEQWTKKADFPGQGRAYQMVTVHNNQIVLVGGVNEQGVTLNDFWQYNPTSDEWKVLSPYPPGVRYQGVVYSIQNKIYTGLGKENWFSPYNEFYEFDPSTNSWAQSYYFHFGMDYGDIPLYFTIANGYYIQSPWGKLFEFDPNYGWSYLTTISNGIKYAFNDHDDIVFIDVEGNVALIDFSTWLTKAELPSLRQHGNRANYFSAMANNRIYIGLGTNPWTSYCYSDMIYLDLNDYR